MEYTKEECLEGLVFIQKNNMTGSGKFIDSVISYLEEKTNA